MALEELITLGAESELSRLLFSLESQSNSEPERRIHATMAVSDSCEKAQPAEHVGQDLHSVVSSTPEKDR